jgi:mannose-6-phosphate isomerase-like protein (cupin superfamily)
MKILTLFLSVLLAFTLVSCAASSGRIISPQGISELAWTDKEKAAPSAARLLHSTKEASYHLIRIQGAEELHAHDRHDLTVFMLSGKGVMTYGGQEYSMTAGDVVEIPKGVAHKAVNTSPEGSEVFAIFVPAFDGKDHRSLESA